jgi:pyruvate formate lyase activating enzyme
MQRGLIFNVQRYSVHDGPGIRTTVFLKGCPLRCAWCHNPEGISPEPEILVMEGRCLHCGECRQACPVCTEREVAGAIPAQKGRCRLCGKCVEACPSEARRIAGREVTVAELLEEILRDRVFYEESGGGVTFSGGEPLAQPEFLQAILRACKERGLHTAVETCGMVSTRYLQAAAPFTDLFLYDLKIIDDSRHREFTGASNARILENLKSLAECHDQIWIRVPIIPNVNAASADLEATARFTVQFRSVRQVNLLPYHRNGAAKTQRAGRKTIPADTLPPTAETLSNARAVFERAGLKTLIGG